MADDPYAYLSGLSEHPDRPGDTSNFNPAFAGSLASALRQANAQGLHLGVMSGYRDPGQTGSAYDAGGNSSHTYGLASDISGLDGPNGKITNQWAQIAQANGLHNPYGVGNTAEFNHWQLPPQPLEQTPQLLASLKEAKATGNMQNVWSAYNAGGGPSRVATATPIAGGNSHADFITNYAKQIGVDPNLALGIANAEGLRAWSASNPNAASTVDVENGKPFSFGDFQLNVHPGAIGAKAIGAGIDPTDPNQWQAADKFALDQLKAGGVGPWSGDPVAKAYLQTGSVPGTTLNAAANAPVTTAPGRASAGSSGSPVSTAATSALPGFAPAQSNQFLQGASGLDKAMGGKGLEGQPGYGDGGQDQMKPSPMIGQVPAPHIPNAQAAAQTFGTTLNSIRTPLQWGSGTPGSSISATAGPQVAPGVPQGMTAQELQQMQQLQMMQMMGGMGTSLSSPYGGGYG